MSEEVSLSLKDYIKNTLISINEGVIEAAEGGVSISHRNYGGAKRLPKVQTIEFNIAVQINKSSELDKNVNGGLVISIANLNLGRNKKEHDGHETVNTVKFSVDAFLGLKSNGVDPDE